MTDNIQAIDESVYRRDDFTCVYCGFDGRAFSNWRQLTIDHVLPQQQDGSDDAENKVVACQWCNSVTGHMRFNDRPPTGEIIKRKRQLVQEKIGELLSYWLEARGRM